MCIGGCAGTTGTASTPAAADSNWLVHAGKATTCPAARQAILDVGYRLDNDIVTADGGCAFYFTAGVTPTGYGHRGNLTIRENDLGNSEIRFVARRRIAPNLTEPVSTMERRLKERVRCLSGTLCSDEG